MAWPASHLSIKRAGPVFSGEELGGERRRRTWIPGSGKGTTPGRKGDVPWELGRSERRNISISSNPLNASRQASQPREHETLLPNPLILVQLIGFYM